MEGCGEVESEHLDHCALRSSHLKFRKSVQSFDWKALIQYEDTFLLMLSRGSQ